jgi:hypothetical protein
MGIYFTYILLFELAFRSVETDFQDCSIASHEADRLESMLPPHPPFFLPFFFFYIPFSFLLLHHFYELAFVYFFTFSVLFLYHFVSVFW